MGSFHPSPLPWAVAALLTGFLSGSLFQGYVRTGVPFFRMFATIAVVAAGYFVTRAFVALQHASALAELRKQLAQLPEGWSVQAAPPPPGERLRELAAPPLLIRAPSALYLVGLAGVGASVRPHAALRALSAAARALWRVRRAIEPTLEDEHPSIQLVVVPLRPVARIPAWVEGAAVAEPEGLLGALHAAREVTDPPPGDPGR